MKTLFPQTGPPPDRWDRPLWHAFEQLGMTERYESLIASVCYEQVEAHVTESYSRVWDRECLSEARDWMSRHILPWLFMPYAPNAKTGTYIARHYMETANHVCAVEEAAPFISGIGTRLDYHVCKTLADLR